MSLNVNLTPQLEEMIKRKVGSGLYGSASEVVREALRLMDQRDQVQSAKLERLRLDISEAFESGDSTVWNVDEIKQEGRNRRAARSAGA
jgi:antitoxin ParD1/3/4